MKKRIKILLIIILIPIVLITGGLLMKLGIPFDIFLTKDFTKPTKTEQIDYLKEHEEEMTNFVKKQNSKVKSVQWDWDSLEIQEFQPNAGGIPTGEKYTILTIKGKFNKIDTSTIMVEYPIYKHTLYPNLKRFDIVDLSVLKEIDGSKGWVDYE